MTVAEEFYTVFIIFWRILIVKIYTCLIIKICTVISVMLRAMDLHLRKIPTIARNGRTYLL